MDNDNRREEDEGEDEELELVELFGNRTAFDEMNEIIRTRGFIRGRVIF